MVAAILEDEMGYDVNLTTAELGMVYTSLASGEEDLYMAGWLPITHEDYMEEHGDDIEQLGTVYDDARIGLVVPEYVEVESIDEMDEYYNEFEGQIVGIDSGAGIMQNTNEAMDLYDSLADY